MDYTLVNELLEWIVIFIKFCMFIMVTRISVLLFGFLFYPFIWLIDNARNWFEKLFSICLFLTIIIILLIKLIPLLIHELGLF